MAEDDAKAPQQAAHEAAAERVYDLSKPWEVRALARQGDEETTKKQVYGYIEKLAAVPALRNYLILFLIDTVDGISTYHANHLYEDASVKPNEKDILLVLQSNGGKIEPAYLASKTCKRLSKERFVAVVPRQAKSAATLLAFGADEIHMGLMSELGPIDPQIRGLPALGLANALEKLAQIASDNPGSADLWARYLALTLNLADVGYFERLCESAAQYAQRLLHGKAVPPPWTPEKLARHFVHHFKDHGFVIDLEEAKSLLGTTLIRTESPEYTFANAVVKAIDSLDLYLYSLDKECYYVGPLGQGFVIRDRKKS